MLLRHNMLYRLFGSGEMLTIFSTCVNSPLKVNSIVQFYMTRSFMVMILGTYLSN